jgi:hypothetical protein
MKNLNQKQAYCTRMVVMMGVGVLLLLTAIGAIAQFWYEICSLFVAIAGTIGTAWENKIIDRPIFFWISWIVCFVCVLYTTWCVCMLEHGGTPKYYNSLTLLIIFLCSCVFFFCSYSYSLPPFQQVAEAFMYLQIVAFLFILVGLVGCKLEEEKQSSDQLA